MTSTALKIDADSFMDQCRLYYKTDNEIEVNVYRDEDFKTIFESKLNSPGIYVKLIRPMPGDVVQVPPRAVFPVPPDTVVPVPPRGVVPDSPPHPNLEQNSGIINYDHGNQPDFPPEDEIDQQEEVKYPPPMSYHSKMLDFSDL